MAYRGILPENPSFGTQVARGLGSGLGQGISQGAQLAAQLLGERKNRISKNLSGLSGFVSKELKNRGRKSLAEDPMYMAKILPAAEELVKAGYEPYEAFGFLMEEVFPEEGSNQSKSPFSSGKGLISEFIEGIPERRKQQIEERQKRYEETKGNWSSKRS